MMKKNENVIRKLKSIHHSKFQPIGIYRKLKQKTMPSDHPTKVNKTRTL
jgi:hypothetical protein